ncbi:hypothetical protein D7V97_33730 [Corallococcus sp. CA053C]|nr:hypothetical protein D7V97_33730 [Corallococcus sp. CA053C]
MGLAGCHEKPGGGVDAGTVPDAGSGTESSFQTLAKEAHLLLVDERQRFLLSTRDDGTYAQVLPTGEPTRIAPKAGAAASASDGSAALLWSGGLVQERSVWVWRPGLPSAITVSTQARGDVVHDGALSYVAFFERDAEGANLLRVARMEACTSETCTLTTLLRLGSDTPTTLQSGGRILFVSVGAHVWLIDVPTGAVTDLDLGPLQGHAFFSPGGTRYGWATLEGHVQVFDTATGALLWDHVWRNEAQKPGWHPFSPFMLDEENVIVNTEGRWVGAPPEVPWGHSVFVCDGQGCTEPVTQNMCWGVSLGEQPAMYCRQDLCISVRCDLVNSFRDTAGRWLYRSGELGTLLGPVFTEGFGDAVRLKGDSQGNRWLQWDEASRETKHEVRGEAPAEPFVLVPGPRRLLYRQSVTRQDGATEEHLFTWNRQEVVDLGRLEGMPFHGAPVIVRDNPPALYLDVSQVQQDGSTSLSIVRVPL